MKIKVLGSGCTNCQTLEKRATEAVKLLGLDVRIEKVTDYAAIAAYGVMSTPALVVDDAGGTGRAGPKVTELQTLLSSPEHHR